MPGECSQRNIQIGTKDFVELRLIKTGGASRLIPSDLNWGTLIWKSCWNNPGILQCSVFRHAFLILPLHVELQHGES